MPLTCPTILLRLAAALAIACSAAVSVPAQSAFSPVARVNEGVVTAWEVQQRQRMLAALNASPEIQAAALDSLINERLQLQAAQSQGVTVSDEQIAEGIAEFASRGGLEADQFLQLLANAGIDQETIRDFVRAGLAWRDAVRARFLDQVNITEEDVAREQERVRPDRGRRVLLSEIVLPAGNENERADSLALAEQLARIRSIDAFSAAARQYSTAESADEGGLVDWIPLQDISGRIAGAVADLGIGQVTEPIPVGGDIALYQLRGVDETGPRPGDVVIDYAQFLIPGGRTASTLAEAARIEARVDTCDDLYGVAEGLPAGRLIREERPVSQIPTEISLQLAQLDRNEVSTALSRGNALVFLMLCERGASGTLAFEETAITGRLRNEELVGLANIWLAELRSEAYIETLE